VMACAAHGLFTGSANELLSDECIAKVVITDSVPPFRLPADASLRKKLHIASAAPLFALAIRASHHAWLR
jgi:ribose-phosphate pyrophosphokinase